MSKTPWTTPLRVKELRGNLCNVYDAENRPIASFITDGGAAAFVELDRQHRLANARPHVSGADDEELKDDLSKEMQSARNELHEFMLGQSDYIRKRYYIALTYSEHEARRRTLLSPVAAPPVDVSGLAKECADAAAWLEQDRPPQGPSPKTSPSVLFRNASAALTSHAAILAECRKETIIEACNAVCGHCAQGRPLRPTYPGYEGGKQWHAMAAGMSADCLAAPIRRLLRIDGATGGKNG